MPYTSKSVNYKKIWKPFRSRQLMHLKWYSVQFMQFVVTFKACATENGFVRFSFKNVKNFESEKWVFGFILTQ